MAPRTMFRKIWDAHVVREEPGQPSLIYVDLHLVHEVSSPQAFEGLRLTGRRVRRPELTIATVDHAIPTTDRRLPVLDPLAAQQIATLEANCAAFGVRYYGPTSEHQGIVHVIGPEQGLTQPGMVIVCGDSHTSTHGAFGAWAMGIGTSEVEHVLATQTMRQTVPKTMNVRVHGALPTGVTPKDLILGVIGQIGMDGATGHVIEYSGEAIRSLSMDGRMTVCNMSIEAGARAGMIAPDETTIAYLRGRRFAPKGDAFERAAADWLAVATDDGAVFDTVVDIDASALAPFVTWGVNPGQVAPVTGRVPDPSVMTNPSERAAAERALAYMGLAPGTAITDIPIDAVFLGSCTNARLEDLRAAAAILRGRVVHPRVRAMVSPGSTLVKRLAEAEGLDQVFIKAGFAWRESGCSACCGINPDVVLPGERCASTSNRNFEGRQGKGGRTHLVSPQMAVAAAIAGHFVDVRDLG